MKKSSETNCRFQHSSNDLPKAWQVQVQLSQWLFFSHREYKHFPYIGVQCSEAKLNRTCYSEACRGNFIRNVILYLLTLWDISLLVPENHFSQECLTFWSGHHRANLKSIVKGKKTPHNQSSRTQCMHALKWLWLWRGSVPVPHFYTDAFTIPEQTNIEIPWGPLDKIKDSFIHSIWLIFFSSEPYIT